MTADDLPDPPIPDVPSHTPIGLPGRATRRGATRTTVPTRFAYRERVRITEPAAPALVGLHGVVRRYRTDSDTGATVYLVEIDGPAATLAHREQWFTEDALEELPTITATAKPARPVLPSLRPGDRVVLRRLPSGASRRPIEGTVDKAESDPARYLVTDDDGGRGWYSPGDLEPVVATTPAIYTGDLVRVGGPSAHPGSSDLHRGAQGTVTRIRPATSSGRVPVSVVLTEPCPCGCRKPTGDPILVERDRLSPVAPWTPPDPPASSPLDRRTPTLIVTVPLDDPSERPHSVTELIDLIAERWQETGWSVDP